MLIFLYTEKMIHESITAVVLCLKTAPTSHTDTEHHVIFSKKADSDH